MPDRHRTTLTSGPDEVTLRRGSVEVIVALRPFALTVRAHGHRVVRGGGLWLADGLVADQFVPFTEGVVASEDLTLHERAVRATRGPDDRPLDPAGAVGFEVRFSGGRTGRLTLAVPEHELVRITLSVQPSADAPLGPLRAGIDWDMRSDEHFVGLGARHCTQFDQRGRLVQLGADRRYTGPDCPPEMLAAGGIPQGDCAPVPWMLSSRGYGALARTFANGTQFDLSGSRTSISTRCAAGALTVDLLCAPTPAACLRALCRLTGYPEVLPEWGYGFWKSRDVHAHQDDVVEDWEGFRRCDIPLDAIVIDSPWATQYNSWEFNPWQFPDAPGLVRAMRGDGVRTVLWCTPWVNLDSRDGQIPPQPESERSHREPAANYATGAAENAFVRDADGTSPLVRGWWMGTGSIVDFTSPTAEAWWRRQVVAILQLGVAGIKMDDGDGYYIPDDCVLADGRRGVSGAWELGGLHRESLARALREVHGEDGVLFGRSGWIGQHARGLTWGADQASDFWSLRVLVVATLAAAASGVSNWSHDIGGYLGHRLVERCPAELLVRWLQFGCFTPLMQAHSRMAHEPWTYGERMVDTYRAYVLLHEQLVPYVRAAAATAARTGLPIIRPLCLLDPADPGGWTTTDAYGYGPSLWVAPVLDDGAVERETALPRGEWLETWSGRRVTGGGVVVVETPLERIPVWARNGSIIVTYPAEHVARGLGGTDTPERERPLLATLWGEPPCGRAMTRLADGTRIRWREGEWSVEGPDREVRFARQPSRSRDD